MIRYFAALLLVLSATLSSGQDLQPRRWGHFPMDTNFAGVLYGYTSADLYLNPSLRVENATLDKHTAAFSYVRSFELLGKSARFDLVQAYQDGRWEGVVDGVDTSTSRTGFSDTALRFSMNLYGAPPLSGEEYLKYRAEKRDCETIVGAALIVVLPTGHYLKDRLLNLGENRFTIRPQIGMVHSRGPWSFELTGSVWFYTDNDSFFNGSTLEQDPLWSFQSHVVYTFRPGFWLATGAAFGTDGQSTLDGNRLNDYKNNFLWGTSLGMSISPKLGFQLTYISSKTLERSGADSDSFLLGATYMW
ncbi:transporter [Haloferula chungangensis]|uniref:Transporter n=1 Tax=Haloferula chungangensis TaxID=1048331 RepID=A0ABW2LCD7_9BACT